MNKRLLKFIAVLFVVIGVSTFLFMSSNKSSNKSSKFSEAEVSKIEIKELQNQSGPISIMTLKSGEPMRIVLDALNKAERSPFKRIPSYDKLGTSSHLLEIHGKDTSIYNIYIALGPNNEGTTCVMEDDSNSYHIDKKNTENLRELILSSE